MEETGKIKKISFNVNGKDYEFAGGDGGQPGPNSVGSEELKDGAVKHEDLNPDVETSEEDIDAIFEDD